MPPLARALTGPLGTFTREQLVDDRIWYRSDHVQGLRRCARVDSFLYSGYAPGRRAEPLALCVARGG